MTTKILSYYDLDDNDSNKDSRSISGLPELLQRDYHDDHDSDGNSDTGDWHCIDNMKTKMDFPNHRNGFVLGSSWNPPPFGQGHKYLCIHTNRAPWLQGRAENMHAIKELSLFNTTKTSTLQLLQPILLHCRRSVHPLRDGLQDMVVDM